MNMIEDIERQIEALSPEEFAQFRGWFLELDWDRRPDADISAGKLDRFVLKSTSRSRCRRNYASLSDC